MRNTIRTKLFAAVLSIGLAAPAASPSAQGMASEKLQFKARPPTEPVEIFGTAWTIFAEGVIDADAASRLQQFIREKRIPGQSQLVLNSPGGNMVGAIKLGRAIRAADLRTYVGRDSGEPDRMAAGHCYSACSLAFLGGEYRYLTGASIYGVHRFYSKTKSDQDADDAQIMSAAIVQYIRDMEVDVRLFTEMTRAGASELNMLTRDKLIDLNVINNGQKKTNWTVESIDSGVYLKGERDTVWGINKFLLMCTPNGTISLYTIFDPQGRETEVLEMKAVSLLIDGKSISIADNHMRRPSLVNGWINAAYSLDDGLLAIIQKARTVGIAYQYAYDAPAFLGFDGMDFSEGSKKLPGIRRICKKT